MRQKILTAFSGTKAVLEVAAHEIDGKIWMSLQDAERVKSSLTNE